MRKKMSVLSVGKDKVTLGCDKGACEGCKAHLFCSSQKTTFEVAKPEGMDIKSGEEVTVELESGKTVFTVFMALGFPMLMFLPGYFFGSALGGSEPYSFLGGILGVVLGFAISALFFHVKKGKFEPKVVS